METYSVLMPVYRLEKADYFRASIASMLAQSVPTDDFVIVCDGPLTEELEQVIEEAVKKDPGLFQIVCLKTNQGLGIALQKGLLSCKNDLVARMDSDDISAPDRCRMQLEVFHSGKADIVGGNVEEFTDDIGHTSAMRKVPCTDEEIRRFAKRRNPFNHPSVMFRRSSVLQAGGYRDCKGFEDYYLWARMLQKGMTGHNIDKTLVYMRASAGMYERRGSFSYALRALAARWRIHKTGFSGFWDFLISGGGQLIMSAVPVRMRAYFYRRFLRR